ncbi:uncharacterized protein LOC108672782 [Hyalella azteca]|uniref:Uncharacterized protein LOC108672782 n=1 Tax=Hyalella azteca TaxID=294128 RepID=A0A8B7NQL3_HYAAZ|nr:uncharacterized protein LOC108672782 [Hyalella azteca]
MSCLRNFHVICVVLWTMLGLMSSSEVLPEMKSFGAGGKPAETSWKWSRDIVNVQPDPCTSDSGTTGICYKPSDCNEFPEGVGDGSCALGVGVCCTFIYDGCYLTAKYAAAVFENPSYPNPEMTSYNSCPLAITPANNNICQIRLDFGAFTLAGPNAEGVCDQDAFTVTGATSAVPVICGENTKQHMYFEVTPGFNNVVLDVKTSTAGSKWQISVTQIECTSPSRVPSVCLQY